MYLVVLVSSRLLLACLCVYQRTMNVNIDAEINIIIIINGMGLHSVHGVGGLSV